MLQFGIHDRFLQKRVDNNGYKILNTIGQGTFATVYRARDKKTNEIVALKEYVVGRMSPSTSMAINIFTSLPRHPCIVQFKKIAKGGGRVYVVMEHMRYDLKSAMAARRKPYTLMQIKFFMEEILEGVKFLHHNGIVHRDLNPANILVAEDLTLKIGGFSQSARLGGTRTPSTGTRFYKAPEVLMRSGYYTCAMDMWSVGCIMAELVLGKPLFGQGRSDVDQLACIHENLRSPFNLLHTTMATAASFSGGAPLTRSGHDLLERLLAYDPRERISAEDALDHAWFKQVSLRTYEKVYCSETIKMSPRFTIRKCNCWLR